MVTLDELISWTDPLLFTKTEKFDFANPQIDPKELFRRMSEAMIKHKGLGLSANQIGIPLSVFVFGDPESPNEIIPVFNPVIVDHSTDKMIMNESCLSFPGFFVKVPRYLQIRARFANHHGVVNTIKFENLSARIFQHEFDHLQGMTIIHKLSRLQIERNVKKILKQYGNSCKYESGKLWTLVRT